MDLKICCSICRNVRDIDDCLPLVTKDTLLGHVCGNCKGEYYKECAENYKQIEDIKRKSLRDLDIAIAKALGENVMAWINFPEREPVIILMGKEGHSTISKPIPHYSTDAFVMLELDKEMKKRGKELVVTRIWSGRACAKYVDRETNTSHGRVVAEFEILARALAAYKALTGKEWED